MLQNDGVLGSVREVLRPRHRVLLVSAIVRGCRWAFLGGFKAEDVEDPGTQAEMAGSSFLSEDPLFKNLLFACSLSFCLSGLRNALLSIASIRDPVP